jgi:hypothetical protein
MTTKLEKQALKDAKAYLEVWRRIDRHAAAAPAPLEYSGMVDDFLDLLTSEPGDIKVPKPSSGKLKWVLGGIVVLVVANQTGLDDVVITKVQQSYHRAKLWWNLPADAEGKHEA